MLIIIIIKWFIFSVFFGVWISDIILRSIQYFNCASVDPIIFFSLFSLYPVLAMSILCCSFLAPTWLIIEPKSPQSLKIIYQVLKFAAKHKAPLNRSALTYWKDMPSGMDMRNSSFALLLHASLLGPWGELFICITVMQAWRQMLPTI